MADDRRLRLRCGQTQVLYVHRERRDRRQTTASETSNDVRLLAALCSQDARLEEYQGAFRDDGQTDGGVDGVFFKEQPLPSVGEVAHKITRKS